MASRKEKKEMVVASRVSQALQTIMPARKATYKETLDMVLAAIEIESKPETTEAQKRVIDQMVVGVVKNSEAYDILSQIQALPAQIED